jgi:hypothetical protein
MLSRLRSWTDRDTRQVAIPVSELESIVRHEMKHGEGGFQDRLRLISQCSEDAYA